MQHWLPFLHPDHPFYLYPLFLCYISNFLFFFVFFSSLLLVVAAVAFSLLTLTRKRKNEHSMCNYFSNSFERFPFITAIVCCFSKEKIEIVFATCVWTCKNSQQWNFFRLCSLMHKHSGGGSECELFQDERTKVDLQRNPFLNF